MTVFDAIENGDLRALRKLMRSGDDLEQVDESSGRTPLAAAAAAGRADVVRILLRAGVDPDWGGADPPLVAATESGHRELERLLLEAGADPAATGNGDASAPSKAAAAEIAEREDARRQRATSAAKLVDHLHAGEFDAAKRWLASDVLDPDGFDEEGRTALMLAARHGRRDLLRMLTAAGASFELRDDVDGHTALIHALRGDAPDVRLTVSLLVTANADLDRPSADGRTPLMHAVDRFLELDDESVEAFRALAEPLLHSGADVEARDADGRTAWQRVEARLAREDLPDVERRKLERVRRVLERNGARATEPSAP